MPTAGKMMGLTSIGGKEYFLGCVETDYDFSVDECCRVRPWVDPVLTSLIEAFLTSNVTMLQIRFSHLIIKTTVSCLAKLLS